MRLRIYGEFSWYKRPDPYGLQKAQFFIEVPDEELEAWTEDQVIEQVRVHLRSARQEAGARREVRS